MEDDQFERLVQQDDPLVRVRSETPRLAASWLKHGENQSVLQRFGHCAISLAFISAGLFIGQGAEANYQEGNAIIGFMFCLMALFFLYLGAKGIQNSFRFKIKKP
jgi:hypothetical protein